MNSYILRLWRNTQTHLELPILIYIFLKVDSLYLRCHVNNAHAKVYSLKAKARPTLFAQKKDVQSFTTAAEILFLSLRKSVQ